MQIQISSRDVPAGDHVIRCHVARPTAPGRHPLLLALSDIFQLTPAHQRVASRLAGHGFVVVSPEIFAPGLPPGTVYDFERDREAAVAAPAKVTVAQHDADRRAVIDAMQADADVLPGATFVVGFCIGGHLALRAALFPDVRATACFYATGVHSRSLGADTGVDTLDRVGEIRGALMLAWGARDPHIPAAGRAQINQQVMKAGVRARIREYDAEHAFARDEGPRHDPAATDDAFAEMLAMFHSAL